MKYYKICLLLQITALMACSKKHEPAPKPDNLSVLNGTISVLSKSQTDSVNFLLTTNKVDAPNFVPQALNQYLRMEPSSVPFHNNFISTYRVWGYKIFNKLPILNGDALAFDVQTNQLIYGWNRAYTGVNLDNVANSSAKQIKAAFAAIVDTLRYPYRTPEKFFAGKHLGDSTLVATFGYYDLTYDTNSPPSFIKAWKVGTKSGSMYIFIKDETNTYVGRDY